MPAENAESAGPAGMLFIFVWPGPRDPPRSAVQVAANVPQKGAAAILILTIPYYFLFFLLTLLITEEFRWEI